jgi:hypothetical protein
MKLKTLIVTIIVLAALSIGVYIAQRPAAPAARDARENQPLVDRAAIDKAAKIRIADAGKTVELTRQPRNTTARGACRRITTCRRTSTSCRRSSAI